MRWLAAELSHRLGNLGKAQDELYKLVHHCEAEATRAEEREASAASRALALEGEEAPGPEDGEQVPSREVHDPLLAVGPRQIWNGRQYQRSDDREAPDVTQGQRHVGHGGQGRGGDNSTAFMSPLLFQFPLRSVCKHRAEEHRENLLCLCWEDLGAQTVVS